MDHNRRNPRQFGLKGVFCFTAGSAGVVWASRYDPVVIILAYAAYLAAVLIVHRYIEIDDEPASLGQDGGRLCAVEQSTLTKTDRLWDCK